MCILATIKSSLALGFESKLLIHFNWHLGEYLHISWLCKPFTQLFGLVITYRQYDSLAGFKFGNWLIMTPVSRNFYPANFKFLWTYYVWNSSYNKLYSILIVCRSTWMNMIVLTSLNLYRIIYRNDRKLLKTFECTKKSRCSKKTIPAKKSHFLSLAKIPFLVLVGKIRFFLSSLSSGWLSVSTWPSSVLFFLPILITRFLRAWINHVDGLIGDSLGHSTSTRTRTDNMTNLWYQSTFAIGFYSKSQVLPRQYLTFSPFKNSFSGHFREIRTFLWKKVFGRVPFIF